MASIVTFTGDYSPQDLHEPIAGKSEWGIDTLRRDVGMGIPYLNGYMANLSQGQIFATNIGANFYLQSWQDDRNPVYPVVSLNYKGLANGVIPDPYVTGGYQERSMSKTINTSYSVSYFDFTSQQNVTKNVTATLSMRYISRSTVWKYIYKSSSTQPGTYLTYIPPSTAKYNSLDVNVQPTNIQVVITTDAGAAFDAGTVPLAIATAIATAPYLLVLTSAPTPIFGTPYYECEDHVDQLVQ